MPLPEGRVGSACVYFISCIFFIATFAGGSCLVLYMTLPDAMDSIWYAVVGMLLVATPWTFWLLMCVYRIFKYPDPDLGQGMQARNATVAPAGRDDDQDLIGQAGHDDHGGEMGGGGSLNFGKGSSRGSSPASDDSEKALRFAAS